MTGWKPKIVVESYVSGVRPFSVRHQLQLHLKTQGEAMTLKVIMKKAREKLQAESEVRSAEVEARADHHSNKSRVDEDDDFLGKSAFTTSRRSSRTTCGGRCNRGCRLSGGGLLVRRSAVAGEDAGVWSDVDCAGADGEVMAERCV